jgi:hypothetical protein
VAQNDIPTLAPEDSSSGLSTRLLSYGVVLLTTLLMVDPSDQLFHIKTPCFVLVMMLWAFSKGVFSPAISPPIAAVVLLVSVVIPAFWVLLTMFAGRDSDLEHAAMYPKAFLFLSLLFVVWNAKIGLDLITSRLSILIGIITVALVILSKVAPVFFQVIYAFTLDKQNALITEERDQFGIGVGQFYYLSCPLMLFGLGYFLRNWLIGTRHKNWHLLIALFLFVSLVFSGARANLIAGLAVIAGLVLSRIAATRGLPIAAAVAALSLLPVAYLAAKSTQTLLNPTESSNQVKIGHYQSYLQHFGDNPIYLISGQGEGTGFYSEGFNDYTYVTELSFLELTRQFGLPTMLFFATLLLFPIFILFRSTRPESRDGYLAIPYAGYLLVCASNPLLVSSTGMLVVVMVWARALRHVQLPKLSAQEMVQPR